MANRLSLRIAFTIDDLLDVLAHDKRYKARLTVASFLIGAAPQTLVNYAFNHRRISDERY